MSATIIDAQPATEPLSIYIDLVPGLKADLEVISRASLAFCSMVREAAYIVDPSMEVRIELVSGTEASLSLNSWLRSKVRDKISRLSLAAIAFGTISWITHQSMEFGFQQILTYLMTHPAAEPTPDDRIDRLEMRIEDLSKKTAEAFRSPARLSAKQFFRELDQDPSIAGVGITQDLGERPRLLIPKAEFLARATDGAIEAYDATVDPQRRIRRTIETVTLVSPVLVPGKRRWKFSGRDGEFGASVNDGLFVANVLQGISSIPLVSGIQMEVDLQRIEDRVDGAWKVKEWTILRVRRVMAPPLQMSLGALIEGSDQSRDGDDKDD